MKRDPNKAVIQTGLRMPADLADWCKSKAKRRNQSLNVWLLSIIWDKWESENKKDSA